MPLGMLSFAGTLLLLSLYNVGARGVTIPNGAVTFALGLGGLTQVSISYALVVTKLILNSVQLLAGMLEFGSGNSYGATVSL